MTERHEIAEVLIRYATAVDTRDWDLFASCFTDDAIIDYTRAKGMRGGRDEVIAWLRKDLVDWPVMQHLVTNQEVLVEGDRATSRSLWFSPMTRRPEDSTIEVWLAGGIYHDVFRQEAGLGWRIAERDVEMLWSLGPLAGELPA